MAIRYFRKHNYNVDLWMSNGHPIKFEVVGKIGYIRSDNDQIRDDPNILAEIDAGIKAGIGGVREISAAQYDDEVVKKKASSPSSVAWRAPYREEFGAGTSTDTLAPKMSPNREPVVVVNQSQNETVSDTSKVVPKSLRERANVGKI